MSGLGQSEERKSTDGLFLERLQTFMEKSLLEIRAFSERERRPFEETRQHVAEWHCKYLFERRPSLAPVPDRIAQARTILCNVSQTLESLEEVSGIHSFVLAVDASDGNDQGFLGGPVLGREFWRSLRGGGDGGVKTFKAHCLRHTEAATSSAILDAPLSHVATSATVLKRGPANSVKTEVYANVRNALRSTSGVRNAEMKWTNHDRLGIYGVRIVGWPPGIPHQNPSSLTATQNKLLLDSLENGTLRFIRRNEIIQPANSKHTSSAVRAGDPTTSYSWVCEESPIAPSNFRSPGLSFGNALEFERQQPELDSLYAGNIDWKNRCREEADEDWGIT